MVCASRVCEFVESWSWCARARERIQCWSENESERVCVVRRVNERERAQQPLRNARQNERDGVGRRWRSASVLFIKHTSKNGVLKIA